MKRWSFEIDNDKLINLVLSGKKTATTSLYSVDNLPVIGEETIICFDDMRDACIIKTKDYEVKKFSEITEKEASLEGEGDLSLNYWKKTHYNFFKSIDPTFNENSKVIFEIFEVTKNLINRK